MSTTTTGQGNPECYARELRDCKGPVDREHYVSAAVLKLLAGIDDLTPASERGIGVKGPAFLKGDEKRIGIASLVGKVLCEHHNNQLSKLKIDDAGRDLVVAFRDMYNAAEQSIAPEEVLRVDGDKLERWMLKTLCGGLYSGSFGMPAPGMKGVLPPRHWLEHIFKLTRLRERYGVYISSEPHPDPVTEDRYGLSFLPLLDLEGKVAGLRMNVVVQPPFHPSDGTTRFFNRQSIALSSGRNPRDRQQQAHCVHVAGREQ